MNLYKDADCVIFDLDGTLIKSIDVWREVDIKFMEKRGLPVPEGFYAKVSSMNFSQAADYVIAECGVTDSKESIMEEWFSMVEYEYANTIEMVGGAKEFITALKKSGVKTALATASLPKLYVPCLERHGVLKHFDAFVTTDEVKRKKGFPDIYLLAAEKVGVKPERCVVFEDILAGCIGAKAANMTCIGILEEHSQTDWDRMKELCDDVAVDFKKYL